jgi:hypothetical protein
MQPELAAVRGRRQASAWIVGASTYRGGAQRALRQFNRRPSFQ